MNAIVLNSSPLKERGNTYVLQREFVAGLVDSGVDVEEIFLKDLDIRPCLGKLVCWVKTPGKCCQNDDMVELLEKQKKADIWVFATPLYWDGVTGPMKNLLDRLLPLIEPQISIIDGHCRHALMPGVRGGRIVLISTCGFWELDNFDPLVSHIKAATKNIHRKFAGALLRPHGALIKYWQKTGDTMKDVLAGCHSAGREIAGGEDISQSNMDITSSELISRDEYEKMINDNFERLRTI
jgi:multimeric flavodoxin WrbA